MVDGKEMHLLATSFPQGLIVVGKCVTYQQYRSKVLFVKACEADMEADAVIHKYRLQKSDLEQQRKLMWESSLQRV
jgi:hypothetical protein